MHRHVHEMVGREPVIYRHNHRTELRYRVNPWPHRDRQDGIAAAVQLARAAREFQGCELRFQI